ncbi:uncharacterized protein E0L32_007956 [Thyridium curvatum]|uniref:Uncharacterized protein n=1 Tax=Thyridium curvatum TaxID=1093900 RepID=A0A507AKP4_9PEZI|nr:uncharacterized protein E0L32_007956 [Thyridium curvatum]TPX11095.1 hypothetical protein E0L32_007956 [Thyridium curvatum]
MVSFFGLKLGGDKKKKPDKVQEPQAPQQPRKIDQNLLGEGQFFGTNVNKKGVVNGSIRSFSRPGTAYSNRTSAFKTTPYAHDTHNLAASSMYDLSNMNNLTRVPSFTSLKQSASDTALRGNFGNTSTVSLGLPPSISAGAGSSARPSTSHGGQGATKPWVNPLDVHFNRPTPTGSKSPLGQYALQLNVDSDGSSLLGDKPENIADAISDQIDRDEKEAKARAQRAFSSSSGVRPKDLRVPLTSSHSYPSPPESVTGERAVFASSKRPMDRSQSPLSKADASSGPHRPLSHGFNGPTELPSPPMSQEEDDEERASWESRPIIQNVAAKRDTLTINPGRRQSLSMKIEELERTLVNQQRAHEGAARAAQAAQQEAEQRFGQGERRPSLPFAERGPRSQSPAGTPGMRPPMHHGEGPRPQSPMGRPVRPQSPAGMRGPMGGPRTQSPMGRHPRPHSPAGMRGPRPQSPAGFHGPHPHGPAGMRGPPRGPPPRGPLPRPRSPAGMRGPRPDSPSGMRGPLDRPPRPHSPSSHGSRNQSPMARHRRPESPAGQQPRHGQWSQPPPIAQQPRPQSPSGYGPHNHSPVGRESRPDSPVIRHPVQVRHPPPEEAQAPPPRPHSPAGLQAPRSGSPLNQTQRAESPMDPDRRVISPVSQSTISSPLANSFSAASLGRPPTSRPPRPKPDDPPDRSASAATTVPGPGARARARGLEAAQLCPPASPTAQSHVAGPRPPDSHVGRLASAVSERAAGLERLLAAALADVAAAAVTAPALAVLLHAPAALAAAAQPGPPDGARQAAPSARVLGRELHRGRGAGALDAAAAQADDRRHGGPGPAARDGRQARSGVGVGVVVVAFADRGAGGGEGAVLRQGVRLWARPGAVAVVACAEAESRAAEPDGDRG